MAVARVTAGVSTSHVPAIGAAIDLGESRDPYWVPLIQGYEFSKRWIEDNRPDVILLVYNDHATAFSLELIPTFAIGCAASFNPADEGWGARPVPVVDGHPEMASHIAQSVIQQDFDLTIVNRMDVDHGLTVPLSLIFGQPKVWPCRVIPFAVNVVQYPPPSGNRCYQLGKAIRRAIDSFDQDLKVHIWGTGGMSHQLHGARPRAHQSQLRPALPRSAGRPARTARQNSAPAVPARGGFGRHRARLVADHARRARYAGHEVYRFYHVPASNTAVGHVILENRA